MKNIAFSFMGLLALLAFTNFTTAEENGPSAVDINIEESTVEWTGKKLTGEHYGNISLSSGQLLFNGNKLSGGFFEIDMNSITCTDITDEKSNFRLVDHLKSDDFFSVSSYPTTRFEITAVEPKGEDLYQISGDLTIKGKTHPLSFPATVSHKEGAVTATADMKFDRSKYDVNYGSRSFFDNVGDKMIYDDVEMNVRLVATNIPG